MRDSQKNNTDDKSKGNFNSGNDTKNEQVPDELKGQSDYGGHYITYRRSVKGECLNI